MLKYLQEPGLQNLESMGLHKSLKSTCEVIVLTLTLRSVVRLEGKLEEKIKDFN